MVNLVFDLESNKKKLVNSLLFYSGTINYRLPNIDIINERFHLLIRVNISLLIVLFKMNFISCDDIFTVDILKTMNRLLDLQYLYPCSFSSAMCLICQNYKKYPDLIKELTHFSENIIFTPPKPVCIFTLIKYAIFNKKIVNRNNIKLLINELGNNIIQCSFHFIYFKPRDNNVRI